MAPYPVYIGNILPIFTSLRVIYWRRVQPLDALNVYIYIPSQHIILNNKFIMHVLFFLFFAHIMANMNLCGKEIREWREKKKAKVPVGLSWHCASAYVRTFYCRWSPDKEHYVPIFYSLLYAYRHNLTHIKLLLYMRWRMECTLRVTWSDYIF